MTNQSNKEPTSEELKPCPFCGTIPTFTKRDVEPQSDHWYQGRIEEFLLCDCGCCMFDKYFHEGFASKGESIKAWNTRHYEAELKELKEKIEVGESVRLLQHATIDSLGGTLHELRTKCAELERRVETHEKCLVGISKHHDCSKDIDCMVCNELSCNPEYVKKLHATKPPTVEQEKE